MKPFIKWVGGKYRLLPQLVPLLPDMGDVHTYIEPFVGSGALFFALEFEPSDFVLLGDQNAHLADLYRCVRDQPKLTLEFLKTYAEARANFGAEAHYAKIRDAFNEGYGTPPARAAMFIYLNKTCFNGLWRVNKAGKFNVPIGDYADPTIFDRDAIVAASEHLQQTDHGVRLRHSDFALTVLEGGATLNAETFVYFDPPYVPVSSTADFTGYTEGKFDATDLARLHAVCTKLDAAGAKFMLSNSDTPAVRKAFKQWHVTEVSRQGNINSDKGKRGSVAELAIRNYE